jgi:prolyl-tRNA editing enzyme YbaK/EbsC (Cys-tRNA(Pro) deacylase)
MPELPDATRRLLDATANLPFEINPLVFPDGTKTSADAAAAIGCELSAITKSMVFMAGEAPVIVLMPGDLRVDPDKLTALTGHEARRASLEEARSHTGFAAGGTPPFGHPHPIVTFADLQLRRHDELWAAGGTPTTVFPIDREALIAATDAVWGDLAEGE